jgi:hypothetical protein
MPQLTAACKAALPAILAAIKAADGVTNEELAERMGLPFELVRRGACALRHAGQIALVRHGLGGRVEWYEPKRAIVVRRAAEKVAAEKRRARNRVTSARHWEKVRAELGAECDDPVIQRRADPFSPLPFKCKAPASVFHLGGMA